MKCISEEILHFLCNFFFANMFNFIMYACYNDDKFAFLLFFGKFD